MKLSGNTIVITGGTSGIGRGLAERFLELGNKVVICGRRADRLEALAAAHPGLAARVCDVTDTMQREDFAAWVFENHPETNVLVNNAGVQLVGNFGKGLDVKRLHAEVETNFVAVAHFSALFAERLAARENAAILNISSGLAFAPMAFMPVYCATKAAVHTFTLSLRHQLKAKGIDVVEIIPPSVDTELGGDRRSDPSQSHGGLPVAEFVDCVIAGLRKGEAEIAVGDALNLRKRGESLFEAMNSR
jgi:uncharacterized oxidoreductase